MSSELTDKRLFKAVQAGDEHAFEILFRSYYNSLCNSAQGIVKEASIAEELVADLFFSIWVKRERIEIKTSVSGYLHFATRNSALNYLKTKKVGFVDIENLQTFIDKNPNPETRLISMETLDEWEERISQLPPQRQKVFRMNKLQGLSYAEIASQLDLSENTVRNQVQMAVRSLKVISLASVLQLMF